EDPAVGLADPLCGDPGPARLNLRPESLLPGDAVAVGVILAGDIEAILSGWFAGVLLGPFLGRSILPVVEAIGLPLAPEAGDAIPSLVVALPVAIDPEPSRGRDAPGPGDPDEVLASGIILPVATDPFRSGAGRIEAGPLGDRRRGFLVDVHRVAILAGREEGLMEGPFRHRVDRLVGRATDR